MEMPRDMLSHGTSTDFTLVRHARSAARFEKRTRFVLCGEEGRAAPCAVRAARTSVRRPVRPVHTTQASSSACRMLGSLTASGSFVAPGRLRCRRGPKSTSGWAAGRPGLGELRFGSRAAPGGRVPALTTRALQSAENSRRKLNSGERGVCDPRCCELPSARGMDRLSEWGNIILILPPETLPCS